MTVLQEPVQVMVTVFSEAWLSASVEKQRMATPRPGAA